MKSAYCCPLLNKGLTLRSVESYRFFLFSNHRYAFAESCSATATIGALGDINLLPHPTSNKKYLVASLCETLVSHPVEQKHGSRISGETWLFYG